VGRNVPWEAWTTGTRSATSLTSRRARITPEQAGLPAYGGGRRVAGLRREEVALLAGVSVDYYTRLERGNARGASDAVLDALARALQLDEAERTHLFDLARAANATTAARAPRRPARQQVRLAVQRIRDSMTTTPAYLRNGRMDILTANQLGRALYSPVFDSPARPVNHARFIFLDPSATEFYAEWECAASDTVALLRAEAGRNPHDRALSALIGELSTRSETFRRLWAAHNVRFHRTGLKRFRHPVERAPTRLTHTPADQPPMGEPLSRDMVGWPGDLLWFVGLEGLLCWLSSQLRCSWPVARSGVKLERPAALAPVRGAGEDERA
jgi:transcriptional regulator with XRE-family HTH domain